VQFVSMLADKGRAHSWISGQGRAQGSGQGSFLDFKAHEVLLHIMCFVRQFSDVSSAVNHQ
jgi:hypothetical protein